VAPGEFLKVGEMTYDVLGPGPLDYLPCRYDMSRLLFRGPKRNLNKPYLAFIGSNETYGKFIAEPFPALVENVLGITCANFGQMNAGVDVFCQDKSILQAASRARVTVIQVLGAQNMTNRFYTVHPRRNDRFVAASSTLKSIYREVDFSDFHFTKHMISCLYRTSPKRFERVQQELQEAWVARMRLMLRQINGKSILLWFSDHAPEHECVLLAQGVGKDPLFVTRAMINEIRGDATQVVEVCASAQSLDTGTQGMFFNELEEPAAKEMLGPMAHQEAADALVDALRRLQI
jgi:hypothetical protein